MTRRLTPRCYIAAVLGGLFAPVALAQMTSAGQEAGQPSAKAKITSSVNALLPGVLSSQAALGRLGQRKKSSAVAVPFDSSSSIFLASANLCILGCHSSRFDRSCRLEWRWQTGFSDFQSLFQPR